MVITMQDDLKIFERYERLEEADRELHRLYNIEREIENRKKSGGDNLEKLFKEKAIVEKRVKEAIERMRGVTNEY